MAEGSCFARTVQDRFGRAVNVSTTAAGEVVLELPADQLERICLSLRDESDLAFELLLDVCVVDYQDYGVGEWQTESTTLTGFERGVDLIRHERPPVWDRPRFAVVYHLLSVTHNHRVRLRLFVQGEPPQVPSVNAIWPSANWYEREAFDLYGVVFDGHPDLRRLLTDYGFVGHPFRKDFPLSGHVEVRYDAAEGRVVYQPVTLPPRTLVPKTIRRVPAEDPASPEKSSNAHDT